MALTSLIIYMQRFYYFDYINIIKMVQFFYVTASSLRGDQYEITHTSGSKIFEGMTEYTLEISYLG